MTVPVKTSPVFTAGTPRLLLDANASDIDLARDGRVLIVEALDPAAARGPPERRGELVRGDRRK